jgi:hypothetical protein
MEFNIIILNSIVEAIVLKEKKKLERKDIT